MIFLFVYGIIVIFTALNIYICILNWHISWGIFVLLFTVCIVLPVALCRRRRSSMLAPWTAGEASLPAAVSRILRGSCRGLPWPPPTTTVLWTWCPSQEGPWRGARPRRTAPTCGAPQGSRSGAPTWPQVCPSSLYSYVLLCTNK